MKKCSIEHCLKEAAEKNHTLCKTHFYYLVTKPKRAQSYKDSPEIFKTKWAYYRRNRKKRREIERRSFLKTKGLFIFRKKLLKTLKKIIRKKTKIYKLEKRQKKLFNKKKKFITLKKNQILRIFKKYALIQRRKRRLLKKQKLISRIEKMTGYSFKRIHRLIRSKITFCRRKRLSCSTLTQFLNWYINTQKFCFYCKIPETMLQPKSLFNPKNSPFLEIDRKDSRLGYITDNMVFSCSRCNITKSSLFNSQEMLVIAKKYIKPKWQV